MYPDAKKLNQQFKYADRRGFQATIIAGADELAAGVVQVKWMESGEQSEIPWSDDGGEVVEYLNERLS